MSPEPPTNNPEGSEPAIPPVAKIRLDQDDPVLESFKREVRDLRSSMLALVSENRSLLNALGQSFAPNVSQGGYAQTDTGLYLPPTVPVGSASTSAAVAAALGDLDRGGQGSRRGRSRSRQVPLDPNSEEEIEFGGSPHFEDNGGDGSGDQGSQKDEAWWASHLRPRAAKPMTMPRYGEFNTQDILNLGAQAMSKVAIGDEGQPEDGAMAGLAGTAGGFLSHMANTVPYLKAAGQVTGIDLGPRAVQANSQTMGYSRGGTDVGLGPFGFTVPGSQYFGPAGGESLRESFDAIKTGLHSGISIREARDLQQALKGEGYTANDLHNMTKVLTDIKQDKNLSGDVGSAGTMANMTDRMMRFGTNSIEGLSESIRGMGDVAIKSRMSLDEAYNALDQFATAQQQKGATYTQGWNTGKQWMNTTGLTAEHLSQFQDNGIVQGIFSQQSGLLPQEMGTSPLGTQMDSIYKAMDLVRGAYGHLGPRTEHSKYGDVTVTSQQQQDALVAQQMGTTPDVIAQMRRDRKRNEAGGWLETFAGTYGAQANAIHQMVKDRTGDPNGARAALNAGALTKNGQRIPGTDMLNRMMADAGFTRGPHGEIAKVDEAHSWDRERMINQILASKKNAKNDANTVTVQLAPELRGKFGLTTSDIKKQANSATLHINAPSGTPNPLLPPPPPQGMH